MVMTDGSGKNNQEIFNDLCYLLECEMATLDYLRGVKRTPKHELRRHEDIVKKTLLQVRRHVFDGLVVPRHCGRVVDEAAKWT